MRVAILAGGKSRRFQGNKLLQKVGNNPLIQHTIDRIKELSEEIYIITKKNQTQKYMHLGYPIITDIIDAGPLGGIYTAVTILGDVLVVPGDMPLIPTKILG